MYIHIYIYTRIYIYKYTYINISIYVCMYVHMYPNIHRYTCIYIHVYIESVSSGFPLYNQYTRVLLGQSGKSQLRSCTKRNIFKKENRDGRFGKNQNRKPKKRYFWDFDSRPAKRKWKQEKKEFGGFSVPVFSPEHPVNFRNTCRNTCCEAPSTCVTPIPLLVWIKIEGLGFRV